MQPSAVPTDIPVRARSSKDGNTPPKRPSTGLPQAKYSNLPRSSAGRVGLDMSEEYSSNRGDEESSSNPFDDDVPRKIYGGTPTNDDDMFGDGGLFNLTRNLTSLSTYSEPIKISEFIMDHQKLTSQDLPLLKSKIDEGITKIELMCNKLEGSVIIELCKHFESVCLKVLTTLNLADNFIGDEGAKALGNYLIEPGCVLHSLTVSNNRISDKGGVQLVQSLQENKSLEILNLDCNDFTDVMLAEFERTLSANPLSPLLNLSLAEAYGKHKYTKQGAKCLWRVMSNLTKLTITGDPPFTLGGHVDEVTRFAHTSRIPSKLNKAKEILIGQELDVFHNIALESIQRMRVMSHPMIEEDDE